MTFPPLADGRAVLNGAKKPDLRLGRRPIERRKSTVARLSQNYFCWAVRRRSARALRGLPGLLISGISRPCPYTGPLETKRIHRHQMPTRTRGWLKLTARVAGWC